MIKIPKYNNFVMWAGYIFGVGQMISFDIWGWWNIILWTVPYGIIMYIWKEKTKND